jgi:hypothetical protein
VGTVTSVETGQQYHFLFTGHILVTATGQAHFSGVDINLTPIGGEQRFVEWKRIAAARDVEK